MLAQQVLTYLPNPKISYLSQDDKTKPTDLKPNVDIVREVALPRCKPSSTKRLRKEDC